MIMYEKSGDAVSIVTFLYISTTNDCLLSSRDYSQVCQDAQQAGLSSHLGVVQQLNLSCDNNPQFQLLEASSEVLDAINSGQK